MNKIDKIIYSPQYIKVYTDNVMRIVSNRINEVEFKDDKAPFYVDEMHIKRPLYICIMDGAVQFFTSLTSGLQPGYCSYINASSYGDSQDLTVERDIKLNIEKSLPNANKIDYILIVDDICDSGRTLKAVKATISNMFPGIPIETCVMIDREREDKVLVPNYFMVRTDNDAFFAGYGLDDKGFGRNIPYIYDCKE